MSTPITYRLWLLSNAESLHAYPYVAVSAVSDKVISVCEGHIEICPLNRCALSLDDDYMLTSRSIEVDTQFIDDAIHQYVGDGDYELIGRFAANRHMTITHYDPITDEHTEHDLFNDYPDTRSIMLVAKLFPILEEIKTGVERIE